MPAIKNTLARRGLLRLQELVRTASQTLYTCSSTKRPVPIRPMSDSVVDTDGTIWFFTDRRAIPDSDQPHRAQLFYANSSEMVYLSVSGDGTVVTDPAMIGKIRRQTSAGSDPASGRLIRVRPSSAFSWNARSGVLTPILREPGDDH